MKQILFSLFLALSLSAFQPAVYAQSSIDEAKEELAEAKQELANAKQDMDATRAEAEDNSDEVVAYSDSVTSETMVDESLDQEFEDRMEDRIKSIIESIAGPGIVAALIFGLLICLAIFFAPLIIIFLIVRYFIKRNNARVRIAENAMANGGAIPESLKPIERQDASYLHDKGVLNVALGAGLFVMFWLWDWSMMQGVGALIAIYGAGQMYLSRTKVPADNSNINRDAEPEPEAPQQTSSTEEE